MAGGRDGDVLWDDAAFRARVVAACKLRGISTQQLIRAAGASQHYLKKPVEGRSTNVLMKIARELGMPPAELAFGVIAEVRSSEPEEALKDEPAADVAATQGLDLSGHLDAESLRRLIATMFTAQQVMALLYLALNQKEPGLPAISDLILKAAHGSVWAWPAQESNDENAASSCASLGMGIK